MRRPSIILTAVIAAGTLALVVAGSAPAKNERRITLDCNLSIFAQGPPQGTPPSGIQFGFAECPRPFGRGLHYSTYTVTPSGPGRGTIAGTFKNAYNRGTAGGTFTLMFSATSPTNITYAGTVTYTRGTGAFSHVRGSGTITCTSSDAGAHKACSVHSSLTGI